MDTFLKIQHNFKNVVRPFSDYKNTHLHTYISYIRKHSLMHVAKHLQYNHVQRKWEKLRKLRKNCHHKKHFNRILNKQFISLQELPTQEMKQPNYNLVPSLLPKNSVLQLYFRKQSKSNVKLSAQIKIFSGTQ